MKTPLQLLPALTLALALLTTQAQETPHYVNGGEGLRAATLPKQGLYYRNYLIHYRAATYRDGGGDELNVNLDLESWAWVHRLLWVTDVDVAGADLSFGLVVPVVATEFELENLGVYDREEGVADISVSPLTLSWHGDGYDLVAAYDVFLPVADYNADEPASLGKEYWTHMLTLGGTYYLDAARRWHASILGRYEIHSERRNTDIQAGDDFHVE